MAGSGAGVVRLYDKFAETGGQVPKGTVRFEAEGRAWVQPFVRHLAEVTSENVGLFATDRWDWSAMGVEVAVGLSDCIDRVSRSPESEAVQQRFLGWLMFQAAGRSVSLSNDAASKYRKMQRELGIVVSPELFEETSSCTRRLDWESGREVLRVG
jgi:hypothetical protein